MNAYIRAAKKNSALRAQAAKQMAKRSSHDSPDTPDSSAAESVDQQTSR